MKIANGNRLTPSDVKWSERCKAIKTAGFDGIETSIWKRLKMRLGHYVMTFICGAGDILRRVNDGLGQTDL
jgi:ATP-dependent phosphoenolpyruvate carboxykinase